MQENSKFTLEKIGVIKTPYQENAPYQPVDTDQEEFYMDINPEYIDGLNDLDKFTYIYVIFYAHQINRELKMMISPPWADGKKVGVFSSRSPVRPNPIGVSIVLIKDVIGNRVYTSGLDVFDGTPVLDIKPYIKDLDDKPDANLGWIEEMDDMEHLSLHIKGIPHDY